MTSGSGKLGDAVLGARRGRRSPRGARARAGIRRRARSRFPDGRRRTRPLETVAVEAVVADAAEEARARRARSRPSPRGIVVAPVAAERARDVAAPTRQSGRASPGGGTAARTCWMRRSRVREGARPARASPRRAARVGVARGLREEELLHDQEVEPRRAPHARAVSFGSLCATSSPWIQSARRSPRRGRLEHLRNRQAGRRRGRRAPDALDARAHAGVVDGAGSRSAARACRPCRRCPARCSDRAAAGCRRPARPMLPVSMARFASAITEPVPWVSSERPSPCTKSTGPAAPIRRRGSRSVAAATPGRARRPRSRCASRGTRASASTPSQRSAQVGAVDRSRASRIAARAR